MSLSEISKLIKKLKKNKDEINILEEYISSLDLKDEKVNFMYQVLKELCDNDLQKPEIYIAVLKAFDENHEFNSSVSKIIQNFEQDDKVIKCLFDEIGSYLSVYLIVNSYLKTNSMDNLDVFMSKIRNFYELSENDVYDIYNLLVELELKRESKLFEYFSSLIDSIQGKDKKYCDYPSWVGVQEGENLTLLDTTPFKSTIDDEIVNSELQKEADRATNIFQNIPGEKNLKKIIYDALVQHSQKMKSVISMQIDRVWGPVNSFNGKCCSNELCDCRMLLCKCFVGEDDYMDIEIPDDQKEWYTGSCDECLGLIRNISHAIRIPMNAGGWFGCFCSIKCMEKKARKLENTHKLRMFVELLRDVGIYDRFK